MDIFAQLVKKIIQQQEDIIGPIALEQARKVPGLVIRWDTREIELKGDEKTIINQLVTQYKYLFGQTSVEVCKEAVKELIADMPPQQRPSLLA